MLEDALHAVVESLFTCPHHTLPSPKRVWDNGSHITLTPLRRKRVSFEQCPCDAVRNKKVENQFIFHQPINYEKRILQRVWPFGPHPHCTYRPSFPPSVNESPLSHCCLRSLAHPSWPHRSRKARRSKIVTTEAKRNEAYTELILNRKTPRKRGFLSLRQSEISSLKVPCERDWREHEEFFSRKISVHFQRI